MGAHYRPSSIEVRLAACADCYAYVEGVLETPGDDWTGVDPEWTGWLWSVDTPVIEACGNCGGCLDCRDVEDWAHYSSAGACGLCGTRQYGWRVRLAGWRLIEVTPAPCPDCGGDLCIRVGVACTR